MTTIAYRDGVLAADSCETIETESAGTYKNTCLKLFRVGMYAVALQGESSPGMVWLKWFRSAHEEIVHHVPLRCTPETLVNRFLDSDVDFTAVVAVPGGELFEYDAWGVPTPVHAKFYAVGSGAKAALGAMAHGASAPEAVLAACDVDPYSCLPIHHEKV